jgi:hypothetical protein
MQIKPVTQGGNFTTVFVVDTQPGQCWYRESDTVPSWTDMGTPVRAGGK